MNVRQTIVYWALFALLGGYYLAMERRPAPKSEIEAARRKVLPVFAEDVKALTFRREGLTLRCERRDKRWRIVEPKGAVASADLIGTLVETLTEKQESDVISESPTAEEVTSFGLLDASDVYEFEMNDGKKLTVKIGGKNPPRTAIYAQTNLSPRVLLLGLNVEYYGDLLFEAVKKVKS